MIESKPRWLSVQDAPDIVDADLDQIQIGERQTILLSEQIECDFIVLDDRRARVIARNRGLRVIGTLGILTAAAEKGLINLREAFDDLQRTSFRASSQLLQHLVDENERR
ncbi:MAG: DUF3368 domain-containing protein [Pyrinomonadaceae bacterium]